MNKYEPGQPDIYGYPPSLDGTTADEWYETQDADIEWNTKEGEKNERIKRETKGAV